MDPNIKLTKRNIGKVIIMNIGVLLGLIIALNILIILGFEIMRIKKKLFPAVHVDERAGLPNYKNIPWAQMLFKEEDVIDIEYRSYYGWRRQPYKGQTIEISQDGIRKTNQQEAVNPNATQIVLLGGSTMWGVGCNNENTIPSLLSEIGKGEYHSENFGEVGFNAYQGYLFLQQQLMKNLHPDIVISYDGVNNRYFEGRDKFSDFYVDDTREAMVNARIKEADRISFKNWFYKPIKLFASNVRSRFKPQKNKESDNRVKKFDETGKMERARVLLDSWLATKNLCDQNNIRFVAILQPNAFTGTPVLNHLKLDLMLREALSYYTYVRQLLKEPKYQVLADHFLDLTEVFNGKLVYIDFCHVSPNGNRIIAEHIYAYLHDAHSNK